MNNLLYIGLNGFAGSGKDTMAKMLRTILSKDWDSLEECKEYYNQYYLNPTISATYCKETEKNNLPVVCIAFADQLKNICSSIFGIPVERFYGNKSTAWICINKNFEYTETKPDDDSIITAFDYYNNISNYTYNPGDECNKYWMSLREILVYIGTYVLQADINKNIFVNIVRNYVKEYNRTNKLLKYVILTDIRFNHELDFIHENNGITITITRDNIEQLDNIAEHELDEVDDYDFVIENNGTYDELFEQLWNLVHDNIEFENNTIDLLTRDYEANNYLRLIDDDIYKLCSSGRIQRVKHNNGEITLVDPTGGPEIIVGEVINGTNLIPEKIELSNNQYFIIFT